MYVAGSCSNWLQFSGSKVSPSLDNVHGFRGALLADGQEVALGRHKLASAVE